MYNIKLTTMKQVKAIVEFEIEEKTLEGFALISDNSLVIEDVNKKFYFYDSKKTSKTILVKDLKTVYLNEDKLSIILSYKTGDVHFKLTQRKDDFKEAYHCIAYKF